MNRQIQPLNNNGFVSRLKNFGSTTKGESALRNNIIGIVNGIAEFIKEILFVGLPVLILVIVHFYKGESRSIFSIPEWSFMSVILFGQSLLRIFPAISDLKRPFNHITTSALAALIIVIGLVPSSIILTLILLSETPTDQLVFWQQLMFYLSIFAFFTLVILEYTSSSSEEISEAVLPDFIEKKHTEGNDEKTKI